MKKSIKIIAVLASAIFFSACQEEKIEVESITVDKTAIELAVGQAETITATVLPENAFDKTVEWTSSNSEVASVADGIVTAKKPGTAVISAKISTFSAKCTVNVFQDNPYVDLGLSVNWAKWNLGATEETAYGDLFAWGEIETKEVFDWRAAGDYKWGVYDIDGAPNRGMTKYNATDNKKVLETADDAATANWGGKWRMPTKEECEELAYDCDWEWIKKGNVWGFEVTGSNGNSIFLPAAGRSSYLYPTVQGRDAICYYWSSTANTRPSGCGPAFLIIADEYGSDIMDDGRCYGQSIRPVCAK